MNKDEIKKALECCISRNYGMCKHCPNYDYKHEDCMDDVKRHALNLITEQEKEIERLRTTLGQCSTELNSALKSLKSQCREIGELKAGTKQAKIDVLNEAKKCSCCDNFFPDGNWHRYVLVSDIDELIKEVQDE